MLKENIDYQLIPANETDNPQGWDVRILEGDFVETIIRFGQVKLNNEDHITFNYKIVETVDDDLREDNLDLQDHAGAILEAIIKDGLDSDTLVTKENNDRS